MSLTKLVNSKEYKAFCAMVIADPPRRVLSGEELLKQIRKDPLFLEKDVRFQREKKVFDLMLEKYQVSLEAYLNWSFRHSDFMLARLTRKYGPTKLQ